MVKLFPGWIIRGFASLLACAILYHLFPSPYARSAIFHKLSPANIDKIIEAIRERKSIEKYAHVASLNEIKENDYNLNIPRYVDTFEEEEVIALDEVARELQDVKEDIEKSTQDLFAMVGSLIGTTDEAKDELDKFISLLGK